MNWHDRTAMIHVFPAEVMDDREGSHSPLAPGIGLSSDFAVTKPRFVIIPN